MVATMAEGKGVIAWQGRGAVEMTVTKGRSNTGIVMLRSNIISWHLARGKREIMIGLVNGHSCILYNSPLQSPFPEEAVNLCGELCVSILISQHLQQACWPLQQLAYYFHSSSRHQAVNP
ncbi:hypothetical protein OPV22_032562 [Ensete ventricosum]|uniref:Uncharacterized protein n=1 Tax=Ensete ventricosum TaxID=4639 RepID=A0AAV8P2D5_ENSVE|nr:hypothetical protein OPV22_032562 [Ensete ventricosum]